MPLSTRTPFLLPRNEVMVYPASAVDGDYQSDDASVSSTVTVERLNDNNKNTNKKRRRRQRGANNVSFHPKVIVVPARHSIDDAERLWYNKRDFATFRAYTAALGKQLSEAERTKNKNNSNKDSSPLSYTGVVERAYQQCCSNENGRTRTSTSSPPSTTNGPLVKWLGMTTCCVGAERAIVHKLRQEKRRCKREYIAAVLQLQQLTKNGCCTTPAATTTDMNNDVIDERNEMIRMHCEQISRPGKLFAQTMAAAYIAAAAASASSSSGTVQQ